MGLRGLMLAIGLVGGLMLPARLAADVRPQKPVRIMSTSQCTDMMLLQLVPRDRIASVTYLAANAAEAIAPGLGKGVPVNHGSAEELLAQKPDLILAGDLAAPMTVRLARRLHAPIVTMKTATHRNATVPTEKMPAAKSKSRRVMPASFMMSATCLLALSLNSSRSP